MEQNQRTGYKAKRRKAEEWTVAENCHEPIVSRELYEAAHEKLDRKSQAKKVRSDNSLARLFLCGCCGHTLTKRNGKYTREKLSREEMRNLRDRLQEEINELNETLAAWEKEQGELSHVPNVSEKELTVITELSEFNAKAIKVLVKNITLFEDGNIEIIWNTDDFFWGMFDWHLEDGLSKTGGSKEFSVSTTVPGQGPKAG